MEEVRCERGRMTEKLHYFSSLCRVLNFSRRQVENRRWFVALADRNERIFWSRTERSRSSSARPFEICRPESSHRGNPFTLVTGIDAHPARKVD